MKKSLFACLALAALASASAFAAGPPDFVSPPEWTQHTACGAAKAPAAAAAATDASSQAASVAQVGSGVVMVVDSRGGCRPTLMRTYPGRAPARLQLQMAAMATLFVGPTDPYPRT